MEIHHHIRATDPTARRRVADPAGRAGERTPPPGSTAASGADAAHFGDAATIARYVDVLKTMNPSNLHRVDELRARIADGSYSADPDELARLIVGDDRSPSPTSGPRSH